MYFPGKSITATLFFLLATLCSAQSHGQQTLASASIPWSSLSLSGSKLATRLTVTVTLGPAAELARLQPWAGLPQTSACTTLPTNATMLSTHLSVTGVLQDSRYSEGLWFDQAGEPQKRLRYNQKPDDYWLKEYCWEKTGVRRSKLVPAGKQDDLLKPPGWSEQTASWYAMSERPAQCTSVSDPAQLLVLASIMAQEPKQTSMSLCVFGRQQLFRLEMRREAAQAQKVSYLMLHKDQPAQQRSGSIQPLVYRIRSQAVPAGSKMESFSLMGLEENIRIFVDPATCLPIRLSGNARLAGKVVLDLREARLN